MNKKELKNKEKTKLKSFRDIIQYLYYRFSYFYEKKESPTGAEINGFFVLGTLFVIKYFTILFFLNVTYLSVYVDKILKVESKLEKYIKVIISLIIILGLVYYAIGKPTYWILRTRFNEEPINQRRKRGWIIVGYIIFTISLFVFSIYVNQK